MTSKSHGGSYLPLAIVAMAALMVSACGRGDRPEDGAGKEQAAQAAEQPLEATKPESIPAPTDVAAVPASAERSESGLAWQVLVPGTGTDHPGPASMVEVHYSGWTTDGNMFDSSRVRGEPAIFPLNRVIVGWTEGVQLMVEGERRRFWIPPELAYKNSTRPGAPQGMLVFDIELIDIKD